MIKHKVICILLCISLLFVYAECKRFGGGGSRSSSRPSSSSSSSWGSRPSSSGSSGSNYGWGSRPSSSGSSGSSWGNAGSSSSGSNYGWKPSGSSGSSQSSNTYGWKKPDTPTGTSHGSTGSSGSSSGTSYGWKKPDTPAGTSHGSTGSSGSSSGTSYGWKKPDTPATSGSSQGTNYGWKKPDTPVSTSNTGSGSSGFNKPNTNPTNTGTGTNYGWKEPANTGSLPRKETQTHVSNPSYPQTGHTVGTGTINNKANVPSSNVGTGGYPVQQGANRGTGYGWKQPDNTQTHVTNSNYPKTGFPSGTSTINNNKPNFPSSNIGPGGYPVQQGSNKYYSGYNHGYQDGYSRGYQNTYRPPPAAQPSNYGFSNSYYPSHNNYGYPGQGIFSGAGSPTYGGMSVFGSNGHYGYPTSSAWNYPTYGTGSSSTSSALKGALVGAVAGYYTHSLVNRLTNPNPWGYSGSGYGSHYGYTGGVDRRTTIINNYYNNQTQSPSGPYPAYGIPEQKPKEGPANWIQCVAYDPMTQSTLINPNCSCTVTVVTDPATNVSSSMHNCTTMYGGVVTEKTPAGRYAPNNAERVDIKGSSFQQPNPLKYQYGQPNVVLDEKEKQRREVYLQLQRIVSMGNFVT